MTDQYEDLIRRMNSPMRNYAGTSDLFGEAATAIKELVAERDELLSKNENLVDLAVEENARAEKAEADLAAAREGLKDVLAHLVAAVSVLEHGGKRGVASDKMFNVMLSDYHKSIERGRAIAAARADGGE